MDNDDNVMSLLRYYDWNMHKVNDHWWNEMDKLSHTIGISYDKSLIVKYPEIDNSTAGKNDNTCPVCYSEFDDPSDLDSKRTSLVCGHEYCVTCWTYQLKEKVKTDGPGCVFSKCP